MSWRRKTPPDEERKVKMKIKQMKAYTLIKQEAREYTLDASVSNIANFIMSQSMMVKTIVFTSTNGKLVCSTIGQFLDRVPDQRLVPFLHQHIIPLQNGEKEPVITLPEPKPARVSDLDDFGMRSLPAAEELSNYLFEQEAALTFKSPYGYQQTIHLYVSSYEDNNSLYIGLLDLEEEEEWGDLTTNVTASAGLEPYCAAVKNYTENEGMDQFIEDYALGTPTGRTIQSGFVSLPVYQFDKNRLAMLSVNGVGEYEKHINH